LKGLFLVFLNTKKSGEQMEKFKTEFKETNKDGDFTVSVTVFPIESGKLEEKIDLLRKAGFKITIINADSIDAEFVGGYDSIIQAIDQIKSSYFIRK